MVRLIRKITLMLAVMTAILGIMPSAMAAGYTDAAKSTARICVLMGEETPDGEANIVGAVIGGCIAVGNKKNGPVEYFVTNRHIVSGEGVEAGRELHARQAYIIFDDMENPVPASIEYIDDRCDLAVVKLDSATTARKPIVLRTILKEKMDERFEKRPINVFTVGFSGAAEAFIPCAGVEDIRNISFAAGDMTAAPGVITRIAGAGDTQKGEIYVVNQDISRCDSGTPMVNSLGWLLGVNTRGIEKYSYAISANEVARVLDACGVRYSCFNLVKTIVVASALFLALAAVLVLIISNRPVKGRVLIGVNGSLEGQRFVLKRKNYIGCDSAKCAVVFPDSASGVSKIHCCVRYNGRKVTVMDMNSESGTWINHRRLDPKKSMSLHRGNILFIGSEDEGLMLRSEK